MKKIYPDNYVKQFEDMPFIVAVAAETMNIPGDQGDAGLSPGDIMERAESAISRYPVHAKEICLITLAILADSLIPNEASRSLLREHLARMDELINEAAWSSQLKRTARAA
ncbi:MAG: hypothetical protein HZB71_05745 [Betaproteobacteria bacterium]|nr:hypothetical protein [Betaproteobacteria bacterium]